MHIRKPLHLLLVLATAFCFCATKSAGESAAPQSLQSFHRVVIADDALPVQKAAADELAHYAGQIAGQKIAVMKWSD